MAYSSYLKLNIMNHVFPEISPKESDIFTTALSGARMGDFVLSSCSIDLQGVVLRAYVSADDTVTVTAQNIKGTVSNLGAANIYLRVFKI